MEPTLLPGDRLYIERPAPTDRSYHRGQIVVVEDPETPGRWLIKRVQATAGDSPVPGSPPLAEGTLYLTGDNATASRDSRTFGPVPVASVVGTVEERYWPLARKGLIPGA